MLKILINYQVNLIITSKRKSGFIKTKELPIAELYLEFSRKTKFGKQKKSNGFCQKK